jgi:Tol biopolymer transport system component
MKFFILVVIAASLLSCSHGQMADRIHNLRGPNINEQPKTDNTSAPERVTIAQAKGEALVSVTENACNPIPSPDGSMIAFVRTGRWEKGSGGLGRSNLRSQVMVMDTQGRLLTEKPLADAFLAGWTSDGKNLICYRDGQYLTVSPDGETLREGRLPNPSDTYDISERIAFLSTTGSFLWLQNHYKNIKRTVTSAATEYITRDFVRSVINSSQGEIARFNSQLNTDAMVVPSPNERYLALIRISSAGGYSHLWIYDRQGKSWADLGDIVIHPEEDWDYIKPTWNPWFADSSRVAFISPSSIVISSPDGRSKQNISNPGPTAGLAVPSPDGKHIAYATFEPRQMKQRPDLKFWGGSRIWVIPTGSKSKARPVTAKNEDTTYCLRWLNNSQLVFDRIADESFYSKARLWKTDIPQ